MIFNYSIEAFDKYALKPNLLFQRKAELEKRQNSILRLESNFGLNGAGESETFCVDL
jgi:hypothetical protein